ARDRDRPAIRQIDPHKKHVTIRSWGLDKSRSTRQQVRKQLHALCARHLACVRIDERVGTVTHAPACCDRHLLELFALHGLDREPPEFWHGTNDRHHVFLLGGCPNVLSQTSAAQRWTSAAAGSGADAVGSQLHADIGQRLCLPCSLLEMPHAVCPRSSRRSRAARCSAIMMAVRFVFARGTSGMMDASTTRKPSVPMTRHSGSTTARGSSG